MPDPVRLVSTHAELERLADEVRTAGRMAIDTEFVWERTYRPDLGVVQIATDRDAAVVDAVALRDLSPLFSLLRNREVPVVLHGGGQDLEIFATLMRAPVRGVVDTQLVAAFLGYGLQVGLAALLDRVLGVRLKKDLTYSDWTRRPLRPEQLAYAVGDVVHLLPLHDRLAGELAARGREPWAAEELRALEEDDRWREVPPDERYRSVKGWQRHDGRALAVLRSLAAWRERGARRANVRPGFLAGDIVLVTLAGRPVRTMDELRQVRGLSRGAVERHGKGILAAIAEGLETPEAEWPSAPPRVRRRSPAPGLVALLRAAVQIVAEREDIAAEVIASGREIEALASTVPNPPEGLAVLRGWRRELVGDSLLAIARGEVALRYDAARRSVVAEPLGERARA